MHDNPFLELHPGGAAELAVILVHGRGRKPEEMMELARALGVPNARYVFPTATDSTWYPKGFLAPIGENEPFLSAALARYEAIVAELIRDGFSPDRIVLGGFSQGACLTAEFLARHPRRYGGAAILTGGLIGPEGTKWPVGRALAGVPVYLTTSEIDEWVPAWRVRETQAWLKACGAAVETTIFPTREHVVSDEEIRSTRKLIEGVRAAAGAS